MLRWLRDVTVASLMGLCLLSSAHAAMPLTDEDLDTIQAGAFVTVALPTGGTVTYDAVALHLATLRAQAALTVLVHDLQAASLALTGRPTFTAPLPPRPGGLFLGRRLFHGLLGALLMREKR